METLGAWVNSTLSELGSDPAARPLEASSSPRGSDFMFRLSAPGGAWLLGSWASGRALYISVVLLMSSKHFHTRALHCFSQHGMCYSPRLKDEAQEG